MSDTPPIKLYAALLKAQQAFGAVVKNKQNPHLKNFYADLVAVLETIERPLWDNGLIIVQRLQYDRISSNGRDGEGVPILITELIHVASGEKLESVAPVLSKDPSDPQKIGAAITYYRRYSLLAILSLAAEDDDGHSAAQPAPQRQQQHPARHRHTAQGSRAATRVHRRLTPRRGGGTRRAQETGMLTFGSLFAGIGGMDLGLERAGLTCRWQVEIDPWCRRVLTKHWPDVPKYGDIREVIGEGLERVDLICGGFPCQDISNAGKRAGIDGERSGLWSEYIRLVRVLRPRYVLVENVAALLGRGLDRVLGDLAASGYDCEWDCLPAAAVGAPHLRDRLFVVAYPAGARHATAGGGNGLGIWSSGAGLGPGFLDEPSNDGEVGALAYAHGGRRQQRHQEERGIPETDAQRAGAGAMAHPDRQGLALGERPAGERAYAPVARGGWWEVEPSVGRVADGIPGRVDRLRGLGNAVVPQVAEWIGRRLGAA